MRTNRTWATGWATRWATGWATRWATRLATLVVILGVGSGIARLDAQEKPPAAKEDVSAPAGQRVAQPQASSLTLNEEPPPSAAQSSRFFVRGEWVYLQRDTPKLVVARQETPLLFFDDVNMADFVHFSNEHGLRLTAGRVDELGGGVELSYLGLHEWDEQADFAPTIPGGISSRTALLSDIAPFNNPALYGFNYASKLHSLELNGRRGVWARDNLHLALLAGVRYLKVEEDFLWSATGANGAVGIYASSTDNDLFGLQFGGDLQIDLAPGLSVGGITKAGVFVNFSEQNSSITGGVVLGAPFNVTGSGEDETVAAIVELGVNVSYQLGSSVRLSVGYNALFIYGLALAPRQLRVSTAPDGQNGLNYGGASAYHGPTAGIEFTW